MKNGLGLLGISTILAVSSVSPSAANAAYVDSFSLSDISNYDPITFDLAPELFLQDANSVIVNISNLVATGGLNIPKMRWAVNNEPVTLDIQSVRFRAPDGTLVQTIDATGDPVSTTVSANKAAVYIDSGLGTWNCDNDATFTLAQLQSMGAISGTTVTLYADFYVVGSDLASGWNWSGGLSGDVSYTIVPELASFSLLGIGSAALLLSRRK